MTSTRRVGIWIRVSTTIQADGDSPEHHLHRARAYAEQQGWDVAEVYRLEGVSGRTVHEHPEMARMVADIESGRIQGLIFSSLSRLARKKATLWQLAELFKKHSAAMVCLDMAIDTSSAAGVLMFDMFSAFAEFEAELIADRIRQSTITRAKMGKSLGGDAVFGYRWREGRLEPDPQEAPVRRLMYELYIEHQSYSEVARQLNASGYQTRGGFAWSAQVVCNLICDPTAKGLHVSNKFNPRSKRKAYGPYKPQGEWITNQVEPIVDAGLWERCNQIAESRRVRRPQNAEYPFSGLVSCACGGTMYHDPAGARMANPKFRCKKCSSSFPASALLGAFKVLAWEYFDPIDGQRRADLQKKIENKEALLAAQRAELSKAKASANKIEQDYLNGPLTAQRFNTLSKSVDDKIKRLNAEVAKLQGQKDALSIELMNLAQSSEQMQARLVRWDELNARDQNDLARLITHKIEYNNGRLLIEIEYDGKSKK